MAAIFTEACLHLPSLAPHLSPDNPSLRVRTGTRPASATARPCIGTVPGCDGLVLAAGHEGSGLTMALSTAELVSGLLTGGALPAYADAFTW